MSVYKNNFYLCVCVFFFSTILHKAERDSSYQNHKLIKQFFCWILFFFSIVFVFSASCNFFICICKYCFWQIYFISNKQQQRHIMITTGRRNEYSHYQDNSILQMQPMQNIVISFFYYTIIFILLLLLLLFKLQFWYLRRDKIRNRKKKKAEPQWLENELINYGEKNRNPNTVTNKCRWGKKAKTK